MLRCVACMGVVMSESVQGGTRPSSERTCTGLHSKNFARVAKLLWPRKTAAELAFRAGVSERAAKYWLSGKYKPTPRALMAVMNDLIA